MTAEPPAPRARYHHGALQEALIAAADAILVERGVEGFSLREAARRAGVSPAAPAHHFRSAAGLLTELAIRGFRDLTRALLSEPAPPGADAVARLHAMGIGYVRYALTHPGRFQLMYRKDLLEPDHAALHESAQEAKRALEGVIRDCFGLAPEGPLHPAGQAALAGAWSIAHGFALLALGGSFGPIAGQEETLQLIQRLLPAALAPFRPG